MKITLLCLFYSFLSIATLWSKEKNEFKIIKVNHTWNMLTIDVGDMIKHKFGMGLDPVWGVHKKSTKDVVIRILPQLDKSGETWVIKCEFGYYEENVFVLQGGYSPTFSLKKRDPWTFTGFPEDYQGPLKLVDNVVETSIPLLMKNGFIIKATLSSSESKEDLEAYVPIMQLACGPDEPYWFRYFEL
jgi:hypothetical protein